MESIWESIWIELIAGFIATVLLSGMMLMKNAMGLMPQFDMISMMSGLMNTSHTMARVVHFVVGTALQDGVFGWWAPARRRRRLLAEGPHLGRRGLAHRRYRDAADGRAHSASRSAP